MRTAARTDANHKPVVAAFKRLGFYVLDVSQLKNCCDIIVSRDKVSVAVEIKDGTKPPSKRKLTEGEEDFRKEWLGEYALIESIDDVFKLHYQLKGMK